MSKKTIRQRLIRFAQWSGQERNLRKLRGRLLRLAPASAVPGPAITFYIDVISSCNLRCPSCPVANLRLPGEAAVKGLMSASLLERVLQKAQSECVVANLGLFNWSEPLLHPDLPGLVRIGKKYSRHVSISTNLNVMRDIDRLLAAGVDWLRVSLSGFSQETYAIMHKAGNIDAVKANMAELAAARCRAGREIHMEVFYHKYLHNLEEEGLMREFAENLGFEFRSVWAKMMPVEKILALTAPETTDVTLHSDDYRLIDYLALPPKEAIAHTEKLRVNTCVLQDAFITMDVEGNVQLCCAAANRPSNRLGNYLDYPLSEIQKRIKRHDLCGTCLGKGVPVYFGEELPEWDSIARRHIARQEGANRSNNPATAHLLG